MIWILANRKAVVCILANALWCAALLVTTIDRNQWRAATHKANAALAQVVRGQELALAAARKAIADTEARYKEKANEADADHAQIVSRNAADADAYILANRVPACPGRAPSGTPAPASGGSASVPVSVPSGSIVGDADVRACAAVSAYALAAHEWAVRLAASNQQLSEDIP